MSDSSVEDVSSFRSHLIELKQRLTIAVVVYLLGVVVLMNFSDAIYDFISLPLRQVLPEGSKMIFIGAPDVFFTYLKVALLVSLFATSPVTLYEIWAFIAPALYRNEKKVFLDTCFPVLHCCWQEEHLPILLYFRLPLSFLSDLPMNISRHCLP